MTNVAVVENIFPKFSCFLSLFGLKFRDHVGTKKSKLDIIVVLYDG